VNFTREPIIETVITPREGSKLVVRNSKGNGQEDYHVDAVEVVSFGHSFFFRSVERPKSFLVPVGDYEILELRETRLALKNVSTERSIKIGGGRDAPPRPHREREPYHPPATTEEASLPEDVSAEGLPPEAPQAEQPPRDPRHNDRKRDRRRRGRRGGRDRGPPEARASEIPNAAEGSEMIDEEAPLPEEVVVKPPSFISKLFPPPPTLIKETLGRYKTAGQLEEGRNKPPVEDPSLDLPPSEETGEDTRFEE
jgi:hypothetical protein